MAGWERENKRATTFDCKNMDSWY